MRPLALFKAGDFVSSKSGSNLKVIKSLPETESFGLMKGSHKGYLYLVEDGKGQTFHLREAVLKSTLPFSTPMEDKSVVKVESVELPNLSKASKVASDPNEDIILELFEDDAFAFEDDDLFNADNHWGLEKIFNNIDEYEARKNNKPLITTGRKCFSLSPEKNLKTFKFPSMTVSKASPSINEMNSSPLGPKIVCHPINVKTGCNFPSTSFPEASPIIDMSSSPPATFDLSSPVIKSSNLSSPTNLRISNNSSPNMELASRNLKVKTFSSAGERKIKTKTFLSAEERKIKTCTGVIPPKDTAKKASAIARKFESYLKERGETRNIDAISADDLSYMMASFWADHMKKDDSGVHDVTTLDSDMSRLAAHIHRITGLNPTTHSSFVEYRKTKEDKQRQSKQQLGNGQLRNQADALDPEEISHLFETGLINTGSGIGIVRAIYVTFMLVLNTRSLKDHLVLKLGNIRVVKNAEGLVEYAYYTSQWSKTDDGKKKGVSRRGIIPPSSTRSTCFFTYWAEYMRQRALLGPDMLKPGSPLYLQPRLDGVDYVKSKNHCKFLPTEMKESVLTNLVKNMTIAADIDPVGRKVTNTSLRVSSFHGQENLGIDSETGQSISGHVTPATAATYRRKNQNRMNQIGAGLMSQMTGVPAVVPPTHGQLFALRKARPITVVDTYSTVKDFTPQLMSLRRNYDAANFQHKTKSPFLPTFEELSTNSDHPSTEELKEEQDFSDEDEENESIEEVYLDVVHGDQAQLIPSQIVPVQSKKNLSFGSNSTGMDSKVTRDFSLWSGVFCKIKGHKDPHWPGIITAITSSSFIVQFLGTRQNATVPESSCQNGLLVGYSKESLAKYGKPKNLSSVKTKQFATGLEAINSKFCKPSSTAVQDETDIPGGLSESSITPVQDKTDTAGRLDKPSSAPLQDKTNLDVPGGEKRKMNRLSLNMNKKSKLKKKSNGKENLDDDLSDFDL